MRFISPSGSAKAKSLASPVMSSSRIITGLFESSLVSVTPRSKLENELLHVVPDVQIRARTPLCHEVRNQAAFVAGAETSCSIPGQRSGFGGLGIFAALSRQSDNDGAGQGQQKRNQLKPRAIFDQPKQVTKRQQPPTPHCRPSH